MKRMCLLVSVLLLFLISCVQTNSTNNSSIDTIASDTITVDTIRSENVSKKLAEQDSLRMKTLKRYFSFKKDEFDTDQRIWVRPIDAPKYVNQNGFYCYFEVVDGIISALLNSRKAKVKLSGRQYYDIKNISLKQIETIRKTIELFRLMGRTY